ncbi:hypothetical protein ACGFJC_25500 [Nonomuraea fuscirosea]|uniref:hypothetical protein n=1 Tax=Nonomuraea fuscirosea TaxID=1291556 RepID=UPI00343FF3B0
MIGAAYALSARRDLGAGLVPPHPGPAQAAHGLRGPLGLAWRLHRGTALAWIAGAAFISAAIGLGGHSAIATFGQSGGLDFWAGRTGTDDPAEIFFGLVVYKLAVYSLSLYGIMTVLRLRSDQGTELFLSGPVSRVRWVAGHLLFAVAVPVAVLITAGLGLGLGDGDFAGGLAITTAVLPGIWVMVAIAAAAFGLLRRAGTVVAWIDLALAVAVKSAGRSAWSTTRSSWSPRSRTSITRPISGWAPCPGSTVGRGPSAGDLPEAQHHAAAHYTPLTVIRVPRARCPLRRRW